MVIFLSCQSPEAPQPPNIVLIMVDDLGSADLGCYGSLDIKTPNIDQMAREGLLFTQAYSGNTVCAPARSTLMTGQHSGHTGVRGNTGGIALPDSSFTIAEMLKNAGYTTGGFGKWGLGEIGTTGVPEKQGFDRFFGYYHQIHAHDYYPDYLYENSEKVELPGQENQSQSYTAYRIFDETLQFIEQNKDSPFFCYAAWTLPHGKYVIPDSDPEVQLYKDKDWTVKRKNYAAMTSLVDRQLGELLRSLSDWGIRDNTLVIFCSDNGADREFAEYQPNGALRGFKRDLYEGGIRIPMVASWPGKIPPGSQLALPIYFPDFMPTFAELVDLPKDLPTRIDGQSFLPWMLNPRKPLVDRYLYWEYPHYNWSEKTYEDKDFKQALRYKHWKMMRTGKNSEWSFYDLINDPSETDDVAAYHPAKMKKCKEWIQKNRTEPIPQIEPDRVTGKLFR